MSRTLYELCGADPTRLFSPACWRTRMALAHKGLDFVSRPTPFTAIAEIGGGFSPTVPVLDDGGQLIRDSWDIAIHLERTYADRPSLFGGPGGEAPTRFVDLWPAGGLTALITRCIARDIHSGLAPKDQAYFRQSREKRLGQSLEDVVADRDATRELVRSALQPARLVLKAQPFLGGAAPLYADYGLFGSLQWARVASPFPLLADGDPVKDWFERCLDLYDGLGRTVSAAE